MDAVAGTAGYRGPAEVRARAPGKIILAGEHAVVHGSAAVAAAIDLYTRSSLLLRPTGAPAHPGFFGSSFCRVAAAGTLLTAPLSRCHAGEGGGADSGAVELYLRDSGLTFSWPCSRLRGALGEEISANPGAPAPCSPDQLAAIARLLEDQEIPEAKIWLSAGLSAFLFLYTSILGLVASPFPFAVCAHITFFSHMWLFAVFLCRCRPGKAVVTSDLPMGAGLGSSSALCVSMSGALLTAAGAVSVGAHRGAEGWEVLGKGDLELVNQWAFQGEKIIHGKPSGIDNSVSTFGML